MLRLISYLLPVLFLLHSGCGTSGLTQTEGKLVFADSTTFQFDGDVIELRSPDKLRSAFGEIKADGTFRIESLQSGKIARGTEPGTYDVRIVVSDDDYEHQAQALSAIHEKYFQFGTSGLKLEVPSQDVTLTIAK